MKDFKKIAEEALKRALEKKTPTLNEGVIYPEGLSERMHSQLERELAEDKHSLGKHPVFPHSEDNAFLKKIMGDRFDEVAKRYKRAHEVDSINNQDVMFGMMPLVYETMDLEDKHRKELEKLAIQMIREEYDMGDDAVEIHAELTPDINMVGTKKNPTPSMDEMEYKNHEELMNAKDEVAKRRFLNAMIQGAAKKCNHMFHMVEDELTSIEPLLVNKYTKMMASADFMYYVIPKMEQGVNGGVVRVEFPTAENPKAIIYAQAMVFPVLIHELVKGVMELLSAHGLPKNKKMGNFVIEKADYLAAEPWDMRIGPALWGKFTDAIDADDFKLKHHIYAELAALPVKEFNHNMREIMGGTKEGKSIIKNIVNDVKSGLQEDEFNDAMGNQDNSIPVIEDTEDNTGFSFDEFMYGARTENTDDENSDGLDGFDLDELL